MKEQINLAWVYPDILYLNGDRGNILALNRIAERNGLDLKLKKINLEDDFNPDQFDLLYFSSGETRVFPEILKALEPVKEKLETFIEEGKPVIVTGNTINLFGNKILRDSGEEITGLGLIDITSKEKPDVYGDDIIIETPYNNHLSEVSGNQIQTIDLYNKKEKPFGKILYGYGDNGTTLNEGVIKNNSIFTSILGPLLVLNPWLTTEILRVVLENKKINKSLDFDDFHLEEASLEAKKRYTASKKTNLKNIKT